MCGIVGAVARENVVPTLIEGIRRLEYRGYDSTGLAVINGSLQRLVSTARVADLAAQAASTRITGTTGISHTRWATSSAHGSEARCWSASRITITTSPRTRARSPR